MKGAKEVGGTRRQSSIIKAKPVAIRLLGMLSASSNPIMTLPARKELEQDKQRLIDDLRASLEQVKQLKGMLPIGPSCKQVRDDKGYWEQIESYLQEHAEVEVTSSLCPACKSNSCNCLFAAHPTRMHRQPTASIPETCSGSR